MREKSEKCLESSSRSYQEQTKTSETTYP